MVIPYVLIVLFNAGFFFWALFQMRQALIDMGPASLQITIPVVVVALLLLVKTLVELYQYEEGGKR